MLLRLRNSVASMTAMSRAQERTANNLANAGTIGFKRNRAFVEVLNEHIDSDGGPHSNRAIHEYVDFSGGRMEHTGNRFDLAIDGEGFFVLSDAEGGQNRYTRAGRFSLDADGMLRSPTGLQVEGEDGPIQIPMDAGDVEVKSDGTIAVDGQQVGRVSVVTFEDLTVLERMSGSEFKVTEETEPVEAEVSLRQGYVELSNAEPLEAMTGMIKHLRVFEMQQRMLRSTDENLSQSIRQLGRF
ncbi:MAG: flagellar basal-body rod protein FlgF [Rhodothermales bacterium]|nr:flagellar basal-body rod protein FlgF [Rhodothermales bacterium]MBO6780486.1 flagellar basal-body rod protein FlgF [Rhodothermales bacterium]